MPKTLKQVAIDMANAFTRWQLWQGGGSSTLSDLTDVELSDLQTDDVLKYDGNKWINAIVQGGGSVDDLLLECELLSDTRYYNGYGDYTYNYTKDFEDISSVFIASLRPLSTWGNANLCQVNDFTYNKDNKTVTLNISSPSSQSFQCYLLVIGHVKKNAIVNSLHEYSTEEKVVGKWIDGKPLYQISISGSASGTNSTEVNTNFNCTGIALKKVNLTIENSNYGGYTQNSGVYYVNNNNLVVIQTLTSSNIIFRYNIIVEYTKITD